VLVEREIGHKPFQATGFFLQLTEASELAHAQIGVLLFPGVDGGVTHPEPPARSPIGVPLSAWRIADTICSSEHVDRFIGPLLSHGTAEAAIVL